MSHSTKEIDILKQLFENLPDADKQKFLNEWTARLFKWCRNGCLV
mgnify:CR=1 FL=1